MEGKTLKGTITLENGMEAVFFLSGSDVALLERETKDMQAFHQELRERTNLVLPMYNIADELATAAVPRYLRELRKEAQRYIL